MEIKTVNWGDTNYFEATSKIMVEYRVRAKKENNLKIEDVVQEFVKREVKE